MKILVTTHSSRFFDSDRANLNSLNKRFESRTLENLPDLETFGSWQQAIAVKGKIAFWEFSDQQDGRIAPRFIRAFEPPFNPQSVCFVDDVLMIAGPDRIMRYGPGFKELEPFTDNWITGTHTIRNAGDGTVWVTSAPANAAIRLDSKTGAVIERLVMPAQYGKGHDLTGADDLRAHFITLDYQPTHINSAAPVGDGILVSLLVPGAVGLFDQHRNYREICSGLRGCHGARVHPKTGEIYVADSPAGLVWYFDKDSGTPRRRLDFHSRWLHDAEIVADNVLLGLLSDHNSLAFMDETSGEIFENVSCDGLGQSTLFCQVVDAPPKWDATLQADTHAKAVQPRVLLSSSVELIEDLSNSSSLILTREKPQRLFRVESNDQLKHEYLILGIERELDPGHYRLLTEAACSKGGLTVGLIDAHSQLWIVNCQHDKSRAADWSDFRCETRTKYKLVIAACNMSTPGPVDSILQRVSIARHV